ncbi:MAG: metallophosphoesterase family protein [Chloroflexi bacterium]|nr:metallophosphoesterase family protein [Chloroflexota bacterium]
MRIAVISDIHSNLVALNVILEAIDALAPDAIWCLGDVVGYGPEPEACVCVVRERSAICLTGNHDRAVAGQLALEDFHPDAAEAALWQREHLSQEALAWLRERPEMLEEAGITLAHGSPRDPVWEYVVDARTAARNFEYFETRLCLVGHSHLAIAWREKNPGWWTPGADLVWAEPKTPLNLNDERWILNPGSVGQPRDHDPRASFALLDTDANTWTWHRHEYDVESVAKAIFEAGLPRRMGLRLFEGW